METLSVWLPAAITGAFGLAVAVVEVTAVKDRKKAKQDRTDAAEERARATERARIRAEESRLSMSLMSATCKLSQVTAKALTHQHLNGDVEDAFKTAQDAEGEYERFLRVTTSDKISKI